MPMLAVGILIFVAGAYCYVPEGGSAILKSLIMPTNSFTFEEGEIHHL